MLSRTNISAFINNILSVSVLFLQLVRMGYSKEQVTHAFAEVAEKSPHEEASSLWLSALCHLREAEVYSVPSTSQKVSEDKHQESSSSYTYKSGNDILPQILNIKDNLL